MEIDLGDVVAEINLRVKHQPVRPRSVFKVGAPKKTVAADRIPTVPQPYTPRTGKVSRIMNLQSDKKVQILGMVDLDEMGNEIGPSDEQPTYTTDDVAGETIVLIDHGDGSGEIAAVGPVGSAQVTATFEDGTTVTETVNVVVGDAASRTFRFSDPTEVTPDEA